MDDAHQDDMTDGGGALVIALGASIIGGMIWFDLVLAFTAVAILAAGWIVTAAGTGRLEVSSAGETTGRRSLAESERSDAGGRRNGAPVASVGERPTTQPSAASAAS